MSTVSPTMLGLPRSGGGQISARLASFLAIGGLPTQDSHVLEILPVMIVHPAMQQEIKAYAAWSVLFLYAGSLFFLR